MLNTIRYCVSWVTYALPRLFAHLEDEVVSENKVGDAGYEDEDGREDSSPQEYDAVRLWQLHQVSDLEASDVIYGEECKQGLQAAHCDQLQTKSCRNRKRHKDMQPDVLKVPTMWYNSVAFIKSVP